jgi:ribosome maturation protein SDO1
MDQERVHFNLARMKKAGKVFEIVIEPDNAIAYRRGAGMDIREALRGERIFSDAKKGVFAHESDLKAVFNSADPLKVAATILKEGEIQLTTEYRDKLREEKRRRILALIQRNAIDPKTKLPHPLTRIENAFEQANCRIDEFQTAEEQIDEVVNRLRTVLPLKIEQIVMRIHVPPQHSHQAYGLLKKLGTIRQESWGADDSLAIKLEIPAGIQEEVLDKMNKMTHGGVDIQLEKELR